MKTDSYPLSQFLTSFGDDPECGRFSVKAKRVADCAAAIDLGDVRKHQPDLKILASRHGINLTPGRVTVEKAAEIIGIILARAIHDRKGKLLKELSEIAKRGTASTWENREVAFVYAAWINDRNCTAGEVLEQAEKAGFSSNKRKIQRILEKLRPGKPGRPRNATTRSVR